MNHSMFCIIIALLTLTGCGFDMPFNSKTPTLLGADQDEHACIRSAGYTWCERTQACERQWELSKEKGFENTRENFGLYCKK